MKSQLIIPNGLSNHELRKEIVKQQDHIHKIFSPLLIEAEQLQKEQIPRDDYHQKEFDISLAFLRDVPKQAVQIVYEWVRMEYATANRTCVRIQFRGNLYEVHVQFTLKK